MKLPLLHFLRHFCSILALLAISLPSLPALAQVESMLVIATRQPEMLQDRAGNSTLVLEQEISIRAASHIQELLQTVPGVHLQRGSGGEYLPGIRGGVLTGAGACGAFLMMQDGVPIRPAGFCNLNELIEGHQEVASQIEVVRGPGSALLGSGAMQGVINIQTVPTVGVDAELVNSLSIDVTSHNYRRAMFKSATEAGNSRFGLGLTVADQEGWRASTSLEQYKLTLWHQTEGDSVRWQSGFSVVQHDQQTGSYIEGADAYRSKATSRSNLDPDAYRELDATRIWTRGEISWHGDERLIVTLFGRNSYMEFLQHFLPGTPLELNGQSSIGTQLTHIVPNASGQLSYGIDLEFGQFWLRQSQAAGSFGPFPTGKQYDYSVDQMNAGLFIQAERDIGARFSVNGGVRFELTDYDYQNRMADGRLSEAGEPCPGGCRYNRPADRSDGFENSSVNLGVSYQPSDRLNLFASLTQGYRPPQTSELYRLQGAQNSTDLNSESVTSIELGMRAQTEKFDLEVVAYVLEKEAVIFLDSDRFYLNGGETEHLGLEFRGRLQLSESWSMRTNLTLANSEYNSNQMSGGLPIDGNRLDTAPEQFGNLILQWKPDDMLLGEVEVAHIGRYYTEPENLRTYPGHTLIHLRGTAKISENLTLAVRVHNLLDKRYADRADYNSFSGLRYFPGEPRAVGASVTWNW